jgi:hypothetical protein
MKKIALFALAFALAGGTFLVATKQSCASRSRRGSSRRTDRLSHHAALVAPGESAGATASEGDRHDTIDRAIE